MVVLELSSTTLPLTSYDWENPKVVSKNKVKVSNLLFIFNLVFRSLKILDFIDNFLKLTTTKNIQCNILPN